MKTSLSKSGYGDNIGTAIKKEFFEKDLKALLDAYGVVLTYHPFADDPFQSVYICPKGQSFNYDPTSVDILT